MLRVHSRSLARLEGWRQHTALTLARLVWRVRRRFGAVLWVRKRGRRIDARRRRLQNRVRQTVENLGRAVRVERRTEDAARAGDLEARGERAHVRRVDEVGLVEEDDAPLALDDRVERAVGGRDGYLR